MPEGHGGVIHRDTRRGDPRVHEKAGLARDAQELTALLLGLEADGLTAEERTALRALLEELEALTRTIGR